MKKYKAIFFDWDGTAVTSRKAPVEKAVAAMRELLKQGIKLVIVSGTTYENIAGGRIQDYFTEAELANLYLGLGRGAYNYRFDKKIPVIFADKIPNQEELVCIHDICYEIHRDLLISYDFGTDIVFCRPNYCKIDMMVENNRGENLFMQEDELDGLKTILKGHGIAGGLRELIAIAERTGLRHGKKIIATCDAKYLEVGISSKSDNVDTILEELHKTAGIRSEDCSFWGDEYVGLEEGVFGSDSFMLTEKTKAGDFYDVSMVQGARPSHVKQVGGGVLAFLDFLDCNL